MTVSYNIKHTYIYNIVFIVLEVFLVNRLILLVSLLLLSPYLCGQDNQLRSIRFATYNVRRKGPEKKKHRSWSKRRKPVLELTKNGLQADIIGFQEPIKSQIKDLAGGLEDYKWLGQSRGSKIKGLSLWHRIAKRFSTNEYCPIFYNSKRFKLIESGTFAINSGYTPNKSGWLSRICTWGLFEDRESGKKFYVYNVHLDNRYKAARINGIKTVFKDIKKRTSKKTYPVVLMGDFNAEYAELKDIVEKAGFIHAKNIADNTSGPLHTSTGWKNDKLKTIDHILLKNDCDWRVKEHVVFETPGEYPSDHRPVYIDVQF